MQPISRDRFQNEYTILIAILLLAAVNGLLYALIMPPWQHYDEPNHFEFVWLLAKRGKLPDSVDYDTEMRRDVAASMLEHNFFEGMKGKPNLASDKPWIGRFSQLNEPPLYYLLASIPVGILPTEDVTFQLYLARLVSLALFLVTVFTGWGVTAEITRPRHPLRFLIPLTMALIPSFVSLMTAVNNDAGAIATFSLFLWGSVRLVRRGPSWTSLLWVLVASALCMFTKRTVYIALPILGIALLFAFLRGRLRVAAWGLMVLAGIVGIVAVFSWGDTALWYRNTLQNSVAQSSNLETPEGRAAFKLTVQPGETGTKLVQIIPPEAAGELSGKSLTLGAWMWATQPIEVHTPQMNFYDGLQIYGERVVISESPQFYAFNFTPQGKTRRAWVSLEPLDDPELSHAVDIYYDGVTLTTGSYPVNQTPQFDDGKATSGTWGGTPFENMVRNASAERGWLYLRPWAERIGSKFFSDYEGQESFSLTVYSLIDLRVTNNYYKNVLANLFRTFWAKFGWGHVPLLGGKPYGRLLLPLTLLAGVGVGLLLWQHRRSLGKFPWDALFILGLSTLAIWSVTIVRGSTYLLTLVYTPVARYAYPAIVPTVLLLSTGWHTILETLTRWLHSPRWVKFVVYGGFFLILNVYALVSIVRYYG